ncbi:MAG: hypothetical protein H6735_32135 [Alphaproteobacteria bacterium]|nr:hypothetical protein [Alphaproteobacteria bacterium]
MKLADIIEHAYAADPIACYVGLAALVLVLLAFPFRRGGIDARYIIQVFATFATIGTVPRLVLWAARSMMGQPDPALEPSGTDAVLALGALLAIVYSGAQELYASFVDAKGDASNASRAWASLAEKWSPVATISAWFAPKTSAIPAKETVAAAAMREKLDQDEQGASAESQ